MTVPNMTPVLTLEDFIADRHLGGKLPQYRDVTPWRKWIVWSKAVEGSPLTPEEVAIFTKHTGRVAYAPRSAGGRKRA